MYLLGLEWVYLWELACEWRLEQVYVWVSVYGLRLK